MFKKHIKAISWLIFSILFVFLIAGCSSYMQAKYEPTTWLFKPGSTPIAAKTTYNVTGATVKSPNEPGWYLAPSKYYGVNFGRKYGEKNETVIALTTMHKVEGFENDRDFLNHMVERRVAEDDASRFKILQANNEFISFKHTACFKYKWLTEDHKNTGINSSEFQYINAIGYICRHPDNPIIAFQMEISYRGEGKKLPEEIRALGEEFFEDIELKKQGLDAIK